jgi:hypothetical protein
VGVHPHAGALDTTQVGVGNDGVLAHATQVLMGPFDGLLGAQ